MKIDFKENEFTRAEIIAYMTNAFGAQINGKRFSSHNITNWVRMGKIPNAYGGHRILKVEKVIIGHPIRIYTLEGLTRDTMEAVAEMKKNEPPKEMPTIINQNSLPRKHRTEYYYKILEKAGKQYTRNSLARSILPDNWKEIGITQNQLARRKR